jgi:hypothetical protein
LRWGGNGANANTFRFISGGELERMRIDSSGNLGLGVTPSAWSTFGSIFQGTGYALAGFSSGSNVQSALFCNSFFNGSNHIYRTTAAASEYLQISGQHQWFTAPSGTAGDTISFTQAMTLDASGNLGVGQTSPSCKIQAEAADGATGGAIKYTATGVASGYMSADADGLCLATDTAGITFRTGISGNDPTDTGTERARITSGGDLLVGTNTTGTYGGSVIAKNGTNSNAFAVINSASSNPYGPVFEFTGAAPNDATRYFLQCRDTGGERATIRSNGGLANYQSNNVDLSDARTKTDIFPLGSYWNKIAGLEIVTYKYKDQTHDDLNIGVIAQQVEAVAPEFVDTDGFGDTPEDGVPLKTIYNKDLTFAAIKALQEAMARIETLEAKIAALEAK